MRSLFLLLSTIICTALFSQNTGYRYYNDDLNFNDIVVEPSGDLLLTGVVNYTPFILKCNSNGDPHWIRWYDMRFNAASQMGAQIKLNDSYIFQLDTGYMLVGDSWGSSTPGNGTVGFYKFQLDHNLDTIPSGWVGTMLFGSWGKYLRSAYTNSEHTDVLLGGLSGSLIGSLPTHEKLGIGAAGMFYNGSIMHGARTGGLSAFVSRRYVELYGLQGPMEVYLFGGSDTLIATQCFEMPSPWLSMDAKIAISADSLVAVWSHNKLVMFDASLQVLWSQTYAQGYKVRDMKFRSNGSLVLAMEGGSATLLAQLAPSGALDWISANATGGFTTVSRLLVDEPGSSFYVIGSAIGLPYLLKTDTLGQTDSCSLPPPNFTLTADSVVLSSLCGMAGAPTCCTFFSTPTYSVPRIEYSPVPNDCGDFGFVSRAMGQVFWDEDQDKLKDSSEYCFPLFPLIVQPGNATEFTDSIGSFEITAADGSYSVSMANLPAFWTRTTDSADYSFTFTQIDTLFEHLDFGLAAALDTSIIDPALVLENTFCFQVPTQTLLLVNNGTVLDSGIVRIELGSNQLPISAAADSIVGMSAYFSFGPSFPFSTEQIVFTEQPALVSHIGTYRSYFIDVFRYDSLGVLQLAANDSIYDLVTCAYDPNDKLVQPSGVGDQHVIDAPLGELNYTIRFQNTGNDTAMTVLIKDQLAIAHLDITSFRMNGSSHTITDMNLGALGMLRVEFANIMLPDSSSNLQGSKGWFNFSIDPFPGLAHGQVIPNNAAIYFDLAPPVITENAFVTNRDCSQIIQVDSLWFDPATNSLSLPWQQGFYYVDFQWYLNGMPLPSDTLWMMTVSLAGNYHVQIIDPLGCIENSDSIMIIPNSVADLHSLSIEVFPNPSDDQLTIQLDRPLKGDDSLFIIDAQGKLVRILAGKHDDHLIINCADLSAGMYMIGLQREDGAISHTRFVIE